MSCMRMAELPTTVDHCRFTNRGQEETEESSCPGQWLPLWEWWAECTVKDKERDEEPPMVWVQLIGQLAIQLSPSFRLPHEKDHSVPDPLCSVPKMKKLNMKGMGHLKNGL